MKLLRTNSFLIHYFDSYYKFFTKFHFPPSLTIASDPEICLTCLFHYRYIHDYLYSSCTSFNSIWADPNFFRPSNFLCMHVYIYMLYICFVIIYVWLCVCMYVCMYVYMYVCMYVYMYVCMYACMIAAVVAMCVC